MKMLLLSAVFFMATVSVAQTVPPFTPQRLQQVQSGDISAQQIIATDYYTGNGTPVNYTDAFIWYKRAAIQGDPYSEYAVATMYYRAKGIPKTISSNQTDNAFAWLAKSAQADFVLALVSLGDLYEHNRRYLGKPDDFKKSDAQAAKWYRKAADLQSPYAQEKLGSFYESGRGVPKDKSEAVLWYHRAAQQGDTAARAKYRQLARDVWNQSSYEPFPFPTHTNTVH